MSESDSWNSDDTEEEEEQEKGKIASELSESEEKESEESSSSESEEEALQLDDPSRFKLWYFPSQEPASTDIYYPTLVNKINETKQNPFQLGVSEFLSSRALGQVAQTGRASQSQLRQNRTLRCGKETMGGLLCLPAILYHQPKVVLPCRSFCGVNQRVVVQSVLQLMDGNLELVFGPQEPSGTLARQKEAIHRNIRLGHKPTARERMILNTKDKSDRITLFMPFFSAHLQLLENKHAVGITVYKSRHGKYSFEGRSYRGARAREFWIAPGENPFPTTDVERGQSLGQIVNLKATRESQTSWMSAEILFAVKFGAKIRATFQHEGNNEGINLKSKELQTALRKQVLLEAYVTKHDGARVRLNTRLIHSGPVDGYEVKINLTPNGDTQWNNASSSPTGMA